MSWMTVCGHGNSSLQDEIARDAQETRARVNVVSDYEEYVRTLCILGDDSPRFMGNLSLNAEQLELLRRLCKMYDIEIRPHEISSHRRVIGPCIVAAKRVLFRIIAALLGPTLRQQREFNATAVTLLAKLSAKG